MDKPRRAGAKEDPRAPGAAAADGQGAAPAAALDHVLRLLGVGRRRLEELAEGTDWGAPEADGAFLQAALDATLGWLGSPMGFLHELTTAPDGGEATIVRAVWPSDVADWCPSERRVMARRLDEAGLWAEAARRRAPVIYNDYPAALGRRGLPDPHIGIARVLLIPIQWGGRVEATLGVGNRPTPYTLQDVVLLQGLADAAWALRNRALGNWHQRRLVRGEHVVASATRAVLEADGGAAGLSQVLGALREGLEAQAVVLGRVAPKEQILVELVHTRDGARPLTPPVVLGAAGPHRQAVEEGRAVVANDLSQLPGGGAAVYEGLGPGAVASDDDGAQRGIFAPVLVERKVWGVLGVLDGPRVWDAMDAVLVERVADVLALAVRRQRERAAHERANQRLRTVFEHIQEGIALIEPQRGRLLLVNPALARLLGVPQEELQRMALTDFLRRLPQEPVADRIFGDLRRILEGEVVTREGIPMPRPDGEVRRVDVTGVAIPWAQGRAVLAVFRDVTDLHDLRARGAQDDRLASLGALAAGVAHEINNPLTYILSTLDSAARLLPTVGQHDLAREARQAIKGVRHIASLTAGLLSFGRAQDDEAALLDLQEPLEHAAILAHSQLKHRARLVKRYGAAPPVLGVDGKVAQVALNLLVNASHAIPAGDHARDHEVRLDLWSQGPDVFFAVEDTGVGIPQGLLHRIFDPFFTTKGSGEGSGLGLSLSRDLVLGMGGDISVESPTARGREAVAAGWGLPGSRFTVRLPAAPKDRQQGPPRRVHATPLPVDSRPGAHREAWSEPGARRRRVLVVDDQGPLLSTLRRMLSLDFDVTAVDSGEEAIQRILAADGPSDEAGASGADGEAPFDLVLCDVLMPGLSGLEVHRVLVDRAPAQARRFAFMSGGSDLPGMAAYLDEHALTQIHKPFDPRVLVKTLHGLMDEMDAGAPG